MRFPSFHLPSAAMLPRFALMAALLASADIASAQCTVTVPLGNPIQPFLNASAPGHVICLAAGTYTENLVFPNWDVVLEGALPLGSTIIDGGAAGSVITINASNTNNTAVRNLVIQNGSAFQGGGINISGVARPTLHNLIIRNNQATDGGGVFIDILGPGLSPFVKFSRLAIEENLAFNDGGGMYAQGISTISTITGLDIQLYHCRFELNSATNDGGGLYVASNPRVRSDHSWFYTNTAGNNGGALYASYSSRTEVIQTYFTDNLSTYNGGAISINGAAQMSVTNSTFNDNNCSYQYSLGGHIFAAGQFKQDFAYLVRNCLFVLGNAGYGGAIALEETDIAIKSSTFDGNAADPTFGYGGALYTYSTGPLMSLTDSILWTNTAGLTDPSGFGGFEIGSISNVPTVTYCNMAPAYPGTGNLTSAPVYANGYTCSWSPVNGYFLNQATSPCVNSGSVTFATSGLPAGWVTNPTGTADSGQLDRGFHYPPTSCP